MVQESRTSNDPHDITSVPTLGVNPLPASRLLLRLRDDVLEHDLEYLRHAQPRSPTPSNEINDRKLSAVRPGPAPSTSDLVFRGAACFLPSSWPPAQVLACSQHTKSMREYGLDR